MFKYENNNWAPNHILWSWLEHRASLVNSGDHRDSDASHSQHSGVNAAYSIVHCIVITDVQELFVYIVYCTEIPTLDYWVIYRGQKKGERGGKKGRGASMIEIEQNERGVESTVVECALQTPKWQK